MQVKRIGYVGLRTDDVEGMTSFFRDVIGLDAVREGETVTFQRLPTNPRDFVEVFAQEHRDSRLIPDETDFVIGFVVDDLEAAMAEVQAAGLEVVGELVRAAEQFGNPALADFGWFFVRAPDGRIFVIEQVPD
jgi:catechol 2,3-dioxygenase-like lactoylglutathione lyase family enzyme